MVRHAILRHVALVGFVVVGLTLSACQEGTPPPAPEEGGATAALADEQEKPTSALPTQLPLTVKPEETFKQGQEVVICDVGVTVTGVERLSGEGSGGSDLLVASLSIENKGEKEVPIVPFDLYWSDAQGKVKGLAFADVKKPLTAGPLAAGETVTGNVPFDVPADEKEVSIVWMPGWCAQKAIIEVE